MQIDQSAVAAAMAVLDRFMEAFSRGDTDGIRAAFNFPHVRFASGTVRTFERPEDYSFEYFRQRPEAREWARSTWERRDSRRPRQGAPRHRVRDQGVLAAASGCIVAFLGMSRAPA